LVSSYALSISDLAMEATEASSGQGVLDLLAKGCVSTTSN